ncbi:phosphatase PAP2 family protein [Streptomyces sp. NP160]|uniref:phosphatase PAP2 family protein n=1 Tax=Streptomyces sp. NP160 TaxID=2586637 RepID=UPI00111AA03F|nr:phosphatase PAP2 family protein [Streptomyces sp. NP160]TNM68038.1 phosphatase PAP2 family protein [Streptomyces sp. NP160]
MSAERELERGSAGAGRAGATGTRSPVVVAAGVLLAAASAVGVWALHRVFVLTAHGQAVDEAALVGARTRLWRLEDSANLVLDSVSAVAVLAALAAVAVVALAQRRVRLALAAVALVGGSLATTQVAKHLLLHRPDLDVTYVLANSLPSGHTTFAGAVSAAALLVAPVRLRPLVAVLGAAYTSAIGVGTLAAGWHRPSDAVAAMLVVLAWGALLAPLAGGRPTAGAGSAGRAAAVVVLVTGAVVGLGAAAAALATTWASVPPEPAGRLGQLVAGGGGALGVGGAACAALLALLLLQRSADRAADRAAGRAADRAADRAAARVAPPGGGGTAAPRAGGGGGAAGGTVTAPQPSARPGSTG